MFDIVNIELHFTVKFISLNRIFRAVESQVLGSGTEHSQY